MRRFVGLGREAYLSGLHFLQTLPSALDLTQQACAQSLPAAFALSQQDSAMTELERTAKASVAAERSLVMLISKFLPK
ncbi:MAG: hypothetical protein RLZZ399_2368 [Verrucomicrobiota bacterium]